MKKIIKIIAYFVISFYLSGFIFMLLIPEGTGMEGFAYLFFYPIIFLLVLTLIISMEIFFSKRSKDKYFTYKYIAILIIIALVLFNIIAFLK